MREIRLYSSEGGEVFNPLSLPLFLIVHRGVCQFGTQEIRKMLTRELPEFQMKNPCSVSAPSLLHLPAFLMEH